MCSSRRNSRGIADAAHEHGNGRIVNPTIPQLSAGVQSPTFNSAIGKPCATVVTTCRNVCSASKSCHRNWDGSIGRQTIAQLTIDILPPTLHRPIAEPRAAVHTPCRDSRSCVYPTHQDRRFELRCSAVIAQLTIDIKTPTLYRPARQPSTTVGASRSDRRGGSDPAHDHGCGGVSGVIEPTVVL